MAAFVATVDAGGLAKGARRIGKSAAFVTRAIAFLERRTGTQLLRRTTRSVRLTEVGERYVASCRRILGELEAADDLASAERSVPRGMLVLTAPSMLGRIHVRPIVDALCSTYADVQVRFLLLDRIVSLVDEGVDVAVRIAHMPDSALVAVKVGEVRRVTCASPSYLAARALPAEPSELLAHDCIAFSEVTPSDTWTFALATKAGRTTSVKIRPRLTVNNADAAIGSAVAGRGVTTVLFYQIERELEDGRLVRLLANYEPEPLPVHVVCPVASVTTAKVRAFVDLAVPLLKAALTPRARSVRASRGVTK
jgi:DNA-binding transcriptional LysR family regulator